MPHPGVPPALGQAYSEDMQRLFSLFPIDLPGIGLATPALAVCCAMVGAYALIRDGDAVCPCAGISIAAVIALALLGPGAYSVNAHLFDRKSVVLNDPDVFDRRKDRSLPRQNGRRR